MPSFAVEGSAHYAYAPNQLSNCIGTCCDYVIVILDGFEALPPKLSKFHMYIFINTKSGQIPSNFSIDLDNFLIFQRVRNSNNLFTIFEKKSERIKQISVWNGKYFMNGPAKNKFAKLIRSLKGEVLRVSSGPILPCSFITTLKNGRQIVGDGYNHRYLRFIAGHDKLKLKWTDAWYQEGVFWGTLYKNGTSTGQVKLILEHQVDVATCIFCGIRLHRNLACSTALNFDGITAMTPKLKPLPSWMGHLRPFQVTVWMGISITIILVTIIFGLFAKLSNSHQMKVDFTLHFMDALHPMSGRNMIIPK